MSVLAILVFCAVALMFGMVAGQTEEDFPFDPFDEEEDS